MPRAMYEALQVTVDGTTYASISAIGIGHIRKDLVLVPVALDDGTQSPPLELGTGWRALTIHREPKADA